MSTATGHQGIHRAVLVLEILQVDQYDHYLKGFQRAAIQTERLSATLNAGQSVVLSLGLTMVLIAAVVSGPGGAAAAANVAAGRPGATAGDLVMIQGLLLQLWAPLQFLGWFYRWAGGLCLTLM